MGLRDPYSQITRIFYFFLAGSCESGSFGPKFKFTAKNNTSGFFQIYYLKQDNKLGDVKNWQHWNMYTQCAVTNFPRLWVQQTTPPCSRVNFQYFKRKFGQVVQEIISMLNCNPILISFILGWKFAISLQFCQNCHRITIFQPKMNIIKIW